MLYLVATPIGNLGDITLRAIEVLKSVDYILCEDTRTSSPLLLHYQIQKPLKSFHKFSEAAKQEGIIDDLKAGMTIALISDAGTPGISDPGTELVKAAIAEGIEPIPIPGACAAIAALTRSGLDTSRFQFCGFLPRKTGELRQQFLELLAYPGTTIAYESPNRLCDALSLLGELAPDRPLVVVRELTKKFEEAFHGTAAEQLAHWQSHILKGEVVLLIGGTPAISDEKWLQMTPEAHVKLLQETYSLTKNEAIKMAAEMRGVPKRTVYNEINRSQ